jgi:group II intron reverse transcriptase/maturase
MAFYGKIGWILEADIASFFDSLDRSKLMEMLRERIVDGALMRLVGKCLRVGVLDGEEFTRPDEGTAQGSIISPLLGNVYLHHVLDKWFEDEVGPVLMGGARLVRYADDFVIGFTRKDEAEMVLALLTQRFAVYGLTLQPDKTRLIPFRRPSRRQTTGKGPETFDLLGFTLHWRRGRQGRWILGLKTRTARYRKAIVAIGEWCRSHRHDSLSEQHAGLTRRLRGHYNYFGVTGNARRLYQLKERVERIWFKWLRRRSHRAKRLRWEWYRRYLAAHPLPDPTIKIRIWATAP